MGTTNIFEGHLGLLKASRGDGASGDGRRVLRGVHRASELLNPGIGTLNPVSV